MTRERVQSGAMRNGKVGLGIVFSALSALIAVACGTTTNVTNVAACGAGTKLVNGVCVADVSGGMDATGPEGDSGEPGIGDAGVDGATVEFDAGADDPCPVVDSALAKIMNCDPMCGTIDPACHLHRCRSAGEPVRPTFREDVVFLPDSVDNASGPGVLRSLVVRLPRDPWIQFGSCNPQATAPQSTLCPTPYRIEVPQPKFYLGVGLRIVSGLIYFEVRAKNYLIRSLFEPRPTTSNGFESVASLGCSRFEPLAAPGELPGEESKTDCTWFNSETLYGNIRQAYPGRAPLLPGESAGEIIAISTNAVHVAARNIVFDFQSIEKTCQP
jgi:hypothetical protein